MVKLRLQRVGRKNDPSFRLVATDSHNGPKSGRFIEILGSHDPRRDNTQIKGERVKYWMREGAQVSPTVFNLLITQKIVEGKKINVLPKKSPIKKEVTEEKAKDEKEDVAPVETKEEVAPVEVEVKKEAKNEAEPKKPKAEVPETKEEVKAEEKETEEVKTEKEDTPTEKPEKETEASA